MKGKTPSFKPFVLVGGSELMPSWSETTAPCWLADGTAVFTTKQAPLSLDLRFAWPCLWSTSSSAPHHAVPLACGRMQSSKSATARFLSLPCARQGPSSRPAADPATPGRRSGHRPPPFARSYALGFFFPGARTDEEHKGNLAILLIY